MMSQDPRHLKEANRKLSAAREAHRAARAAFELRCRAQLPELERLDRAIQGTVAKSIAAALRQGTDPAAAVAEGTDDVSGQSTAVLAQYADRVWLTLGEGETADAYLAALEAAGLADAKRDLVVMGRAGERDESWSAAPEQ